MANIARVRAARGAAFLDIEKPGWYSLIDLTKLDMGSSYHCVLGQLGPETDSSRTPYGVITEELMLPYRQQASHGFCCDHYPVSYDELEEAWKEQINARK